MATLTFEQSKHLVERSGIGAELEMIEILSQMTKPQAIDYLLNMPTDYLVPLPRFSSFDEVRKVRNEKGPDSRFKANKMVRKERGILQRWAISQLLENPTALQERMTWFWHNHFTSSIVRSSRTIDLMKNQTLLMREQALGNYADLLKRISFDPLMLVYLDGQSNKKGKPNENFARELLELFTLGEGNYTDQDVKEVARAFTGWRLNKNNKAVLGKRNYDSGQKVILGKQGRFDSHDVLNILLKHPKTAEFVATKLWYEFVSTDTPETATIKRWAHTLRSNNYEIKPLLKDIFSSDAFWDGKYKGTLIKSPMDIIIGTTRTLDLEDKNLPVQSLHAQLKRMGQELYNPPNVKGWPGGAAWVDGITLPVRQQFLRRLTRGNNNNQKAPSQMMMQAQAKKAKEMPPTATPTLPIEMWEAWLLPIPAITPIKSKQPRQRLQALLLDPAYQLK
ncbi:DUF1800 domain-containing protein [Leucothrix arctica]|uniref:DUF1800 domain-containing protein n=1 Tax=Leucothrix arctica TaxID=1481894 RepID=A0A317CH96_9GAMM|nr:DUF1800 domain-containing protein [Leucothrix arctica]PWQ97926.1 DUF1800 domain-containing protein [Leucothrix arctica]